MTTEQKFSGRERNRIIVAASAGNFAEWFDWGVYGVVATILAKQFFPNVNASVALLSTFGVFALAYVARPLGGIVFGRIADKAGRRKALSLTIILTCGTTALMGLLPTYAQVGVLAPILLLFARMLQAMGAGGEYASAISFIYEHSPARTKARNVSYLISTTFLGIATGSVVARILAAVMSDEAYDIYGWRILFLIAIPLGLLGYYLRSRVEETPEFRRLQDSKDGIGHESSPLRDTLVRYWRVMVVYLVCVSAYALISTTVTSYFATFLTKVNHLTASDTYTVTIVSNVAVIGTVLLAGCYGDRLGLQKMMVVGGVVVAVLSVPALLAASDGFVGGVWGAVLLGACKGCIALPALLAMSQIFPPAVRVTAGALAYNVTQSLFGGTGPLIGLWLNDVTGGPYGFGIYISVFGLIAAIGAVVFRRYLDADHGLVVPVSSDAALRTPAT